MRLLVVCTYREKERIRDILVKNNIACMQNVIFVHDFEKAQDFLDQQLIQNNGHIDVMIVSGSVHHARENTHMVDRLRYSYASYSDKNFKLKVLPAIYYAKEIRQTDYYEYGFDARVEMASNDNHSGLLKTIKSLTKGFREKLYDDLELLRIELDKLQSGQIFEFDPYYYLKIKPDPIHWAARTSLLSKDFIRHPRPLKYDWLIHNASRIEASLDRYEEILKTITTYNRKDSEKSILHRLFNEAPWLLQTDVYRKPIYEPNLMKHGAEFEEPDYILPSGFPGIIPNNVTEVKLPTLPLLQKRHRKPRLKSDALDALFQLGYYRRHVNKNGGREQVADLVQNRGAINYTLLASNEDEREKNHKLLQEFLEEHFKGLKLVTHHEKLQDAIRYYERKFWLN